MPKSLLGRKVELIILPADSNVRKKTRSNSAYGILKKYANPELVVEDGAWASAIKEKYAIR